MGLITKAMYENVICINVDEPVYYIDHRLETRCSLLLQLHMKSTVQLIALNIGPNIFM